MHRKITFLFLCLFGLTLSAFAQQFGQIVGVVKDAESSTTLIGVSLYEEQLQLGTTTDERGHYELSLPIGEHSLRISYIGYTTVYKKVTVGTKPLTLNIKLQPMSEKLSEVQVTSERKDRNVTAMAMSVQTLDMITIKKIPALMGEVDVIKSITLLPGVQSASEGSSGFSVRGGATDHNLILLDGAPIYNASHFLGFFSVFNNDVVKDATLYKGDIPADFGGRLSSVLDVSVKDEMPKRLSLQGGVGLVTSHLMLETPLFDTVPWRRLEQVEDQLLRCECQGVAVAGQKRQAISLVLQWPRPVLDAADGGSGLWQQQRYLALEPYLFRAFDVQSFSPWFALSL